MEDKIEENNSQEDISYLYHLNQESKYSLEIYQSYKEEQNEIKINSSSIKEEIKLKFDKDSSGIYKENGLLGNLSAISELSDEFLDEKSLDYFYKKNKNTLPIEKMIEVINYLIGFFESKFISKNTIIRCFHNEENKKEKEKCHCIPIIKKKLYGMSFSCDNKEYKFLDIENIINIILQNKLFEKEIELNNNNSKEKDEENKNEEKEEEEDKNEEDKNTIKIKKGGLKFEGNCQTQVQKHSHECYKIIKTKTEKLIQKYKNLLNDFNTNKTQKNEIQRKIKNLFFTICKYINDFVYCLIIQKLIRESFLLDNKDKNIDNLLINIDKAKETLSYINKKGEKDESFKENKKQKSKLNWIIPFYYNEEIKNDLDKNIFIAINFEGSVFIYLLNSNEKSQYKLIKMKDLEGLNNLVKIIKLRNLFKYDKINNYFLISSFIKDTALIINVSEEFCNNLEDRFKISIFQTIKFDSGLYSSIVIECKEQNYLLNFHKIFDIWFFNENKNQIELKEIKVNRLKLEDNYDKKRIYGPLIQGKINKNLFITQTIIPVNLIEVFTKDENNGEVCLNQKGFILLNKNNNFFSTQNNNFYLYKDKYLLIASINNKLTQRKGGIYLFDIENSQMLNFFKFPTVISINCIIKKNDNILICSSDIKTFNSQSSFNEGGLFIVQIVEKDDNINLVKLDKKNFEGKYKYIQCDNFLFENYFSSSSKQNNGILRINEKNEFMHYYNIYFPGSYENESFDDII